MMAQVHTWATLPHFGSFLPLRLHGHIVILETAGLLFLLLPK